MATTLIDPAPLARDVPVPIAPAALRSPRTPPFVGRPAELAQLVRMLGAAGSGGAQLAIIQGPAGIGKTRLAEEIGAVALRQGGRFAMGRCWPDAEAPPLWPWQAILRSLGAPESLLAERQTGNHGRFRRFVAVADHLRATAGPQPSVVVLDDAHLADLASLLLARFVARESGPGLLLLLTCRDLAPAAPGEAVEVLSELGRAAVAIPLSGLSDDAVGAYLAASGVPAPEPELTHAVAVLTQGNPLHLRTVAIQSELEDRGLRGSLERTIGRLLERLEGVDRRRIGLAALLGSEVAVHEAAGVADASPDRSAESLARGVELGLLAEPVAGRFRFAHDLVRRQAEASLSIADRLDGHQRAARLFTGCRPDQVWRRAHHTLSAAGRSPADAALGVTTAREAAAGLKEVDGFESAAALLGRAVEVHAAAGLGDGAALAVEQAEAVLACGRLAAARPLFQHAARLAEREGNPAALARAALGLGGVWVSEHRMTDVAERVRALQQRAFDALPAEETVLRARLRVRMAAEAAYHGSPADHVLSAVEHVRRTGDPQALAEALSLGHHALFTPDHTWRRVAVADELIAAAATARDGLLGLVGLCWRAADLFLLGDPGAGRALETLRIRADALRCRSVLFIVRAMEVMLAIRAGEFGRAEEQAAACFQMGTEVGDVDALPYHGAQLSTIRYFQGREAELADLAASMAASPTLLPGRETAFVSAAALFALRAGDPRPGRGLLERLSRDGLASIPPSSAWLPNLLGVVELAHALDDRASAAAAYDALTPFAGLPVMASLAVVCFGSVERCLGLAALTTGNLDLAISHFGAAVTANQRLGHRPAAIQAQAELALARLRRGAAGDPEQGRALLEQAIAAGAAAGMSGLVARWRDADAARTVARRREPVAVDMTLIQAGCWRVEVGGQVATVPDRVGMRYLARLVATPDRGIPALALALDGATAAPDRGPQPMTDRKAVTALRERIRELRGRSAPSAADQEELAALVRDLARVTGLGGRIRSFADAPERARTAVTKAIKRAIREIAAAQEAVGRHLALTVETGAVCCYHLTTPGSGVTGGHPTGG